jgi:outer membrane protein assembly factor BamE (lipoprotein component of BamABCDE complex)
MLAAGCGETILTQWPQQSIFNSYFRLQDVKQGMNRAEVEGIMGLPPVREQGDFSTGQYTFYFYRTHNMDYEGSETVRGGYTPLVFRKDILVGMGRRDYLRAADRPVDEPSPVLPWTRTQ